MTGDLSQLSTEELLKPLRSVIPATDFGFELESILVEVERRIGERDAEPDPFVLPVPIIDRVLVLFGPGRRTFDAIGKRCKFALKVWDGKYGPLTPEQHEYAVGVLLWALDVPATHPNPRAAVYERLDRVVHHERTHAGFRAREGELVDVSAALGELAA